MQGADIASQERAVTMILPLGTLHHAAAFDLVVRVFAGQSTLHRALGVEVGAYRRTLRPGFDAMVGEGLSVVAVEGGAVVGALIACDFHRADAPTPEPRTPIAALTDALYARYQRHRATEPGQAMLVDMGAVAPGHGGRGLYQRMRDAAEDRGRAAGYRHVIGELSSAATQYVVLHKRGHAAIAEIAFAEFIHGGTRPFATIPAPDRIVLAEGHL